MNSWSCSAPAIAEWQNTWAARRSSRQSYPISFFPITSAGSIPRSAQKHTQRVARRIQEAPVITWRASIDPLLTLRISSPIKVQVRLLAVCGHWQTRTAGSAIRVKGGQKRPQIKGARQVLVIPILYRPPLHEKTIPKTVRNECCPGAFNTAKQQNEMYLTYFKFGQPAHLSAEPLQLRVKRAYGLNRLTISDFLLSAKQPS